MSGHGERAKALFRQGCNCAQAVLTAFSDVTGLDRHTSMALASSFGGGLGRLREVCGAVSGMSMAAGLLYGYDDPQDAAAKAEHYQLVQTLAEQFKAENGSIICRQLLGLDLEGPDAPTPEARTEAYYQKRPCEALVGSAAAILDAYIDTHQLQTPSPAD